MTRCDRCGRRCWLGGTRVTGDWRTFCARCFLAAAWEPAQPNKWTATNVPSTARIVTGSMRAGPSEDYKALLRGDIDAAEYVKRLKADVDARLRRRPPAGEPDE